MWLGSPIGFLAEAGIHFTSAAWSAVFDVVLSLSFLLDFCLVSPSVSFPLPAVLLPVSSSSVELHRS